MVSLTPTDRIQEERQGNPWQYLQDGSSEISLALMNLNLILKMWLPVSRYVIFFTFSRNLILNFSN